MHKWMAPDEPIFKSNQFRIALSAFQSRTTYHRTTFSGAPKAPSSRFHSLRPALGGSMVWLGLILLLEKKALLPFLWVNLSCPTAIPRSQASMLFCPFFPSPLPSLLRRLLYCGSTRLFPKSPSGDLLILHSLSSAFTKELIPWHHQATRPGQKRGVPFQHMPLSHLQH